MATIAKRPSPAKSKTTRATISFPSDLHETLEKIARDKKVSLGWVVREAAEKYVADRWPLLEQPP